MTKRICLITSGHVASTPRLVKEADALAAAGYAVHVLAARYFPPMEALDDGILRAAAWTCTRLAVNRGPGTIPRKLLRRLARRLVVRPHLASVRLAARAHHAMSLRLAAAATRLPADLYLGHCLAALPAAVFAARRHGARAGFDLEDFHDAETTAAAADPADRAAAHTLQSALLPSCAHLTAASPLIATQYEARYGVASRVLLNVFPRHQAPAVPVEPGPWTPERPLRVYWFSQTVGPGRGLEEVIAILARLPLPAELHLRGVVAPDYAARLQALARQAGLARPIVFLPPGPAAEMARLAADADLGLATELPPPLNRDLCLTNKIFVYLLAGVPQLLSRTAAQSALAPQLGDAALLCDLHDPAAAAAHVAAHFQDPVRAAAARRHAWRLAQERFCWDLEQEALLDSVAHLLA